MVAYWTQAATTFTGMDHTLFFLPPCFPSFHTYILSIYSVPPNALGTKLIYYLLFIIRILLQYAPSFFLIFSTSSTLQFPLESTIFICTKKKKEKKKAQITIHCQ